MPGCRHKIIPADAAFRPRAPIRGQSTGMSVSTWRFCLPLRRPPLSLSLFVSRWTNGIPGFPMKPGQDYGAASVDLDRLGSVQLDSPRFGVPASSSIAILRRFAEWLADSNKAARSVERIGDPMPLPRTSRVGFQLSRIWRWK